MFRDHSEERERCQPVNQQTPKRPRSGHNCAVHRHMFVALFCFLPTPPHLSPRPGFPLVLSHSQFFLLSKPPGTSSNDAPSLGPCSRNSECGPPPPFPLLTTTNKRTDSVEKALSQGSRGEKGKSYERATISSHFLVYFRDYKWMPKGGLGDIWLRREPLRGRTSRPQYGPDNGEETCVL